MDRSVVNWPDELQPQHCPVHAWNEIKIPASSSAVWDWLVCAGRWHQWYSNCRNLSFVTGNGPDLALGARFKWTTFCVRVDSTVVEFDPGKRLGWSAGTIGASGYHGWVLFEEGNSCRVITEEVQRGLVPWIARVPIRYGLEYFHQRWLEGLADKAVGGAP